MNRGLRRLMKTPIINREIGVYLCAAQPSNHKYGDPVLFKIGNSVRITERVKEHSRKTRKDWNMLTKLVFRQPTPVTVSRKELESLIISSVLANGYRPYGKCREWFVVEGSENQINFRRLVENECVKLCDYVCPMDTSSD